MYHLSAWEGIFAGCAGRSVDYLFAERAGQLTALLPLVSVRSLVFGSFLTSLPWTSYGGVCGSDVEGRAALLDEAIRIGGAAGASHIELHSEEPVGDPFVPLRTKVSMRRVLPNDPSVLWGEFPSKLRSQIRRPEKAGLTVAWGGADQLDAFYRVFARNMRDLGTPVFPRRFFARILAALPEHSHICVVYAERQPVAAGLLLGFKDVLEIPWASSVRAANHLSPNMLLYWESLRHGCEHGYRWFDFGRSTPDSSHSRFKAQWGAKPVSLAWSLWQAKPGAAPRHPPEAEIPAGDHPLEAPAGPGGRSRRPVDRASPGVTAHRNEKVKAQE